ncbi:MAG: hypothetical protein RH859_12530 [Longimicrobiales bacterium]
MNEDERSEAPRENHARPAESANSRPPLPPPAFPPGSRRHQMRRAAAASSERAMDDAFISPDDPLPQRRDALADAMISPDEPIVRVARDASDDAGDEAEADGVVTGMGDDAHLDPEEWSASGDPHVRDLVHRVGTLAEALKRRGEAGLRVTPSMDRFDATLRAYCVGFLAGRRADDEDAADY